MDVQLPSFSDHYMCYLISWAVCFTEKLFLVWYFVLCLEFNNRDVCEKLLHRKLYNAMEVSLLVQWSSKNVIVGERTMLILGLTRGRKREVPLSKIKERVNREIRQKKEKGLMLSGVASKVHTL
ncbi:hypothetical protein L6164_008880 [Bauhinia variegata]|uniref:Uncharacterized protein n=1 Tax=Bauhinia variegata TaxID=167791 RepID=A0ACB9PKW6_BAUVA|nr:hypothetical protein L6164_008880 [Bauhinia variegata]